MKYCLEELILWSHDSVVDTIEIKRVIFMHGMLQLPLSLKTCNNRYHLEGILKILSSENGHEP